MSGNTSTFNSSKDKDDAVIHPTSRLLLRTWERIRGERSAPLRTDIQMRDIVEIVPWTCILKRDPHRMSYTFRLAGSAVCDTWGRPLTGATAFEDWPDFDRETVMRALDTVVGMKQPCVSRFLARSFGGREVGFELTAVPVLANDGKTTYAMTTFAPFKDRRSLDGDPLVDFQIHRIRILWTDELQGQPATTPAVCNDEGRRINTSFLRVIDGGKV